MTTLFSKLVNMLDSQRCPEKLYTAGNPRRSKHFPSLKTTCIQHYWSRSSPSFHPLHPFPSPLLLIPSSTPTIFSLSPSPNTHSSLPLSHPFHTLYSILPLPHTFPPFPSIHSSILHFLYIITLLYTFIVCNFQTAPSLFPPQPPPPQAPLSSPFLFPRNQHPGTERKFRKLFRIFIIFYILILCFIFYLKLQKLKV